MNQITSTTERIISNWLFTKLVEWGVPENVAIYLNLLALLTALSLIVIITTYLTRKILLEALAKVTAKTNSHFDDFLMRNRTMAYVARLIPLIIVVQAIPVVLADIPQLIRPVRILADIYLILLWVWIIRAVLRSLRDYLRTRESFKDKPLDSYLQVISIIVFIFAGLLIFSMVSGKDVWYFVTAMGAATAILMLVFKDTILGFVASIQVSTNDMVRIGDWIEMPKYGADGDVLEINLNTVKVQNWDKTITTIPTYYLITDSFKNWRGMQESGGRRIKRPLHLKISSIRYLEKDEIEELKKIQLLKPFIEERQLEIDRYNEEKGADRSMPVNGRNMTNAGLFRKYIELYTHSHPGINKNLTFIVRQLSPGDNGLPLELYMFTSDIRWVPYEGIMSDIFDHLLSAIKYFKLEIFELPASDDLRSLSLPAKPEQPV
ncbi:miniconductance mechanosensitive channel [Anseongella ginsenosidimutans]|uniref:Mechanosensing system component YbdG n=1 Tax=Anseongella ginsenosidimutans TaxID=496056 RepID=A0A4R3KR77_9SPHI|nr:mechanosensitive ion channel domain-containing protein [Anseongella ginsenosidimutans]QEC52666.1 mechanosensitive ion channel [Anseongella ginsenosidimutans]TCS86593.1 miniconductance mechanosensitive channel [Anseongella ginsenosidimutans]